MRCLYVASHPADEGPGWDSNPGLSEPRAHVFNHNTPYCLQSHEQLQGHQPFAKPVLKFCKDQGICSLHFPCNQFSSVQFSHSVMSNFVTPWTAARQASLSITNSRSPPKPMSIDSVMPSNHLILCRPLLLLPSICPSIRVFTNESALHIRWPMYWSFSFNEHPGLIPFRMDWLDLHAVQGTLKSLLQHHSSKASILWHSAFFIVQLSHPYMTTGKTISLTRWTFVDKLMSLLFNMLSRLVITFLPRSNHLLISCLQSPSAVILDAPKIKPTTVSTVSPSICHNPLQKA